MPDSRTAQTPKLSIVIQHSVAESAVRLVRSTLSRSPLRVDKAEVISCGIFLMSKTIVKALFSKRKRLMLGKWPSAFWN